jgi:hypothetical protein
VNPEPDSGFSWPKVEERKKYSYRRSLQPSKQKIQHFCGSFLLSIHSAVLRIRDVYPGSRILIFTHPGSRIQKTLTKERGEKNLLSYFFCSHKFHKIENYVIFEMLKKKIWANFQIIVEVFTQKIFNMLSNIWVWDPGSEIRDPEKTYSGSRIQGSKRHRIPDPDPQHCHSGMRIRIQGPH